jgi:hypothetical protein
LGIKGGGGVRFFALTSFISVLGLMRKGRQERYYYAILTHKALTFARFFFGETD